MIAPENPGQLNVREIVRQLRSSLGPTLVAVLAGNRDRTISSSWARTDGVVPTAEAQERLELAHRAWTTVSQSEGEHTARLWFIGAHPWLGDISPIEAISHMREKEVMVAAVAIVEDTFAG
ncbi:hypothetical protein [Nesterenkonia halotolerans]|uniref:Antitoxin Xre/MbcA/ParS-like toxin-binding domain-containing protein n=1 Tax=Nesterenkonia halotolerans TaxID=225325 RepID=A0ABR9J7E4_9MICC|nr:hypothetical protein [Nesterenkonia halotolerans]MBE1514914.1 hypothetical protein [Nesterenkonia halotolerans]